VEGGGGVVRGKMVKMSCPGGTTTCRTVNQAISTDHPPRILLLGQRTR